MRRLASSLALLLATAACTGRIDDRAVSTGAPAPMVSPILTGADALDTLTYAEPVKARVTHVALNLELDFEAKRVGGTAELRILADPGNERLVLDSNGLEISDVTDGIGNRLTYSVGDHVAEGGKGAPLAIALDGARTVRIQYRAPADAEALQWLSPEQTAGKVHPFLFSQGRRSSTGPGFPPRTAPAFARRGKPGSPRPSRSTS